MLYTCYLQELHDLHSIDMIFSILFIILRCIFGNIRKRKNTFKGWVPWSQWNPFFLSLLVIHLTKLYFFLTLIPNIINSTILRFIWCGRGLNLFQILHSSGKMLVYYKVKFTSKHNITI